MPEKIAGGGVIETLPLELRLAGPVLERGMVGDKGQVGMILGGLLKVARMGKVPQRPRLRRESRVYAEYLKAPFSGFLVDGIGQLLVIQAEAGAGPAGVGCA